VVAEVQARYPAIGLNDPEGYTLLSCGPARFWVDGQLEGPRVEGTVSLEYDNGMPIHRPAWQDIGPPPEHRTMRGVVQRIRRVPVYIAPPRPGSPEYGRADGVAAGLGAPHDVRSVTERIAKTRQPAGFALPLDRPEPDAGFDGSWGNPQAGGFWTSQGCLIHLRLDGDLTAMP
jgi:hypothetical protein